MDVFGKEIKVERCYEFLDVNLDDNLEEIRKKLIYYTYYAEKYNYIVYQTNYHLKLADSAAIGKNRIENNKIKALFKLTYDSYFAILLHRDNLKCYQNILVGLSEYLNYFSDITAPFKEIMSTNSISKVMSKDSYIQLLKSINHMSTSVGVFTETPSLTSIIEIEKDLLASNEYIEGLTLKRMPTYGELNLFKK